MLIGLDPEVNMVKFVNGIALQSRNSQNFLSKFVRFFVILRCFYREIIDVNKVTYYYYRNKHHLLLISALKTTSSLNNLKILMPKVTKKSYKVA